jgi:hypothetical protein
VAAHQGDLWVLGRVPIGGRHPGFLEAPAFTRGRERKPWQPKAIRPEGEGSSLRGRWRKRQGCQRVTVARSWVQQAHVPPAGSPAWPLIARSPLEAVKPREGPVTPFEPQSSRGFRGSVSPRQEPETHDGAGTRFLVQVAEVAWSHLACSASLGRKTGSGARVVARRRLASPPDEGHGLRDGERVRGLLSSSFPGRGQTNPVADLGLRFQSDGRRLSRCVHGALTGFVKAAARLSGKARGPLRWYGSSGSGGKEASSGVPAGDTRTPEVRIRW